MPILVRHAGLSALLVILIFPNAFGKEPDLQSAQAWFEKGMLYQEAGNPHAGDAFSRAIQDLDCYIGKEPDRLLLSKAYVLRAKCRIFQGQGKQAIPDLDKAIELSPDDGDTYYLRSFADAKNTEKYVEYLKTAARKGNEKARGELTAKGISW